MDLDGRRSALRATLAAGEPAAADAHDEQRRREALVRDVLAWAIDAALHQDLWVRGHMLAAFRGLCDGEWERLRGGLDGVLAPAGDPRAEQSEQEIEEATIVDLIDLEGLLVTVCERPGPPPALVDRYGDGSTGRD
ncbi:MAG: hypothetical protein AB7O45_10345 [Alphaproteobacteria bacterium]